MDHQLPTKEESTHLDHSVSNKVCFCVQWALLSVNSGHMPSSALMCLVSILVPSLQLSLLIASVRLCFKPLIRLSMYSLQSRREVLPVLLNSVPCLPAFLVRCFVDVLPGFDRRLSHCSLQEIIQKHRSIRFLGVTALLWFQNNSASAHSLSLKIADCTFKRYNRILGERWLFLD